MWFIHSARKASVSVFPPWLSPEQLQNISPVAAYVSNTALEILLTLEQSFLSISSVFRLPTEFLPSLGFKCNQVSVLLIDYIKLARPAFLPIDIYFSFPTEWFWAYPHWRAELIVEAWNRQQHPWLPALLSLEWKRSVFIFSRNRQSDSKIYTPVSI